MNKIKLFIVLTALLLGHCWTADAANTVRWVMNTNDSGDGSLRYAVSQLTGSGYVTGTETQRAVDTIRFHPSLKGQTIVFLSTIAINGKNVVIDGEDNNIVLSGDDKVQLFTVNNYGFFTISNLTLSAGYALDTSLGGSAIILTTNRTGGATTINNVRFDRNATSDFIASGGAISIISGGDHFVIDHCTFIGNTTQAYGIYYSSPDQGGGAINSLSENNIEISNCLFENNSSNTSGGAIVARNVTITGCVFKNNSAVSFGGAFSPVTNYGDGTFTAKFLGNAFIENHTQGLTFKESWENEASTYDGGVFGTMNYTNGSIVLAGNVFQDNYSESNLVYNEFYRSNEAVTVTSNGYNVFKGASVPGTAANTWTKSDDDRSSTNNIVNATTGRLRSTSPALGIITTATELIPGLAFPATDIFGNVSSLPYNAGADQGDGEDISSENPLYQNGDEHDIGVSLVGADPLSLSDIVFTVPADLVFTAGSATLKSGSTPSAFTLSGISLGDGGNGANTRLQLTVNFAPTAEQEYTDTLVISVAGGRDFVLPLRGAGISWIVDPVVLNDFGLVAVGKSSVAQPVTITGSSASGAFTYSLKSGAANASVFPVTPAGGIASTGGQLDIRFAPAAPGVAYEDTLVIVSAGSDRSYEIALAGTALPVAALPLSFGNVVISSDSTLTLPVTVASGFGIEIDPPAITAGTDFTVVPSSNWSTDEGGDLLVTFTPSETGLRTATLTLDGSGTQSSGGDNGGGFPYTVELTGIGLARPVIGSDSAQVNFGRVVQEVAKSETLTVTLANPQSELSLASFTFPETSAGIFAVSFDSESTPNVTVTFTPLAAVEYSNTLIINADYADEVRIPLVGTGFKPEVSSVPTSLEFAETEIGESTSATLTVTQSNPFTPLSSDDFSLAVADGSIFGFSFESPSTVTVTFTPLDQIEYKDTLIVQAAYADEVRIPLVGTGILGTGLSVPQESGIYLSVKESAIVVHSAPINSRIVLYSLQGVATLAQTVTSNEEILKTSGFARGVYILAVRNDKGEVLKRKVVL